MTSTEWALPSGKWQSSPFGEQQSFARIDLPGHLGKLSPEQLRCLGLRAVFPPEFRFDPTTGQSLPARVGVTTWTTPDGGHSINSNYVGFGIDAVTEFSAVESTQPVTIASPGNGQFEFLVGNFNTGSEQLIAVNIKDYVLKVWLVDEWVELHCQSNFVPEGFVGTSGWRAELFENANEPSRLYVPANDGLALLKIDATTLSYECLRLAPQDCVKLCGPPMAWLGGLLFPYVDTDGHVALAQIADERRPEDIKRIEMLTEAPQPVDAEFWFRCAVSKRNRLAVWVSEDRVLQINRAWPGFCVQPMSEGYRAAFESLKPFIDANESLWFLVRSKDDNRYIQLGQRAAQFDIRISDRIFACAGQRFFRKDLVFATNDPWSESNQEQDSYSRAHVYPLIDFLMSDHNAKPAAGLTLKFDTLDSHEPWASLHQDPSREVYFALYFGRTELTSGKQAGLIERARAFVYQGRLWFYAGPRVTLQGWRLLE